MEDLKTTREEKIIGLVSSLLDDVKYLEYGVRKLDHTQPFRWFRLPLEEKITQQEAAEYFQAYNLRLEIDGKTNISIAYNVYKMRSS